MKNEINIEKNVIVMKVVRNRTNEVFEAKCDIGDLAILQKHYWVMAPNCLSVACNYRQNGKMVKPALHKILTGSRFVKFLNGDRLDFRKENLQIIEKGIRDRPVGVNLKGNPFFIHNDGVTLFITDKKGKKTGLAFIIDYDDLEKVSQYTWHINFQTGYIQARTREGRGKSKGLYLHRLIMGAQPEDEVDHKNGIKIDNRKKNLRICTRSQNCHNVGGYKNNTNGIRGVSPTQWGTWKAQMQIKGKPLRKTFKTFSQAVAQRKAWEREYNPSGLQNATN